MGLARKFVEEADLAEHRPDLSICHITHWIVS
jgi:hypothetical protein